MEHLKNTLETLMKELSAKKNASSNADPQQWLKKALTQKELGHIKVKYFSKGVLSLSVDSSSWLYALSLKKEEMLSKLKKEYPAIKSINLRIGEI